MYQAKDMGVQLYVCYTSMASTGLNEKMLIGGIQVMRMSEFLQLALECDAQLLI